MGWREFLSNFRPEVEHVAWTERGFAAIAATVAIMATVGVSYWVLDLPYLLPAVGASSVLIFALPASPLAQPWSVFGGYVISAMIGVAMARWVSWAPLAAGLAVGGAIAAMISLRCLHAPAGAVALFAVIGGEPIQSLGFGYALVPVATDAALLVLMGILLNNLIPGRCYPRPHPELSVEQTGIAEVPTRSGFSHRELNAILDEYGHPLQLGGEELDELLAIAERRRFRAQPQERQFR